MRQYLELCKHILENGVDKSNRTGIDTRAIFGYQMRFDLRNSFPAITTKKLAWKAMVSELIWFLEGSSDERRLSEILHGTRSDERKTIWTDNAQASYWKPKAKYPGDLGRVYGVQWRHWKRYTEVQPICNAMIANGKIDSKMMSTCEITEVDQIANIVNTIKNNPDDRRIILSAWNPAELDQMALPPCHTLSQFSVVNGELSCLMYQRSVDTFLGLPFNIASYSLLTCMLAHVTGLKPGDFIWTGGDTHIYHNHFNAVKEQLSRVILPAPKLWLNPEVTEIDKFTMNDVKLIDYRCHESIKAEMAV